MRRVLRVFPWEERDHEARPKGVPLGEEREQRGA